MYMTICKHASFIYDYNILGEGREELVVQLFSRYCFILYVFVSYICILYFFYSIKLSSVHFLPRFDQTSQFTLLS